MQKHEWRQNTDEGVTRRVGVSRHAGKWQLRSRLKSDVEWTKVPDIPLDDLEHLREGLLKKYQRNRVPHEHILEVDVLIEATKLRGYPSRHT